jgi:hypothetical protein
MQIHLPRGDVNHVVLFMMEPRASAGDEQAAADKKAKRPGKKPKRGASRYAAEVGGEGSLKTRQHNRRSFKG